MPVSVRVLAAALALVLSVLSVLGAGPAAAQSVNCTASMSDIAFGTVSLRSGTVNGTSGTLQVDCTGVADVGVCIRIGEGSGSRGSGLSPRFMRRADTAALAYQLRPGGNGPSGGIWDEVHFEVPTTLGFGSVQVPVFADITASGVGTGIGAYGSTFSGTVDIEMIFNTNSCGAPGVSRNIPSFTVSADVAASCEVDSGTLDFGTLGAGATGAVDASTTFLMRCTDGTPYQVRLDRGMGAGATGPTDRRMTGPGGQLRYGLYLDAGRTIPWGESPGNVGSSVGTGSDQGMTVFGRLFGGQPLVSGTYTDSVLITVEY